MNEGNPGLERKSREINYVCGMGGISFAG